MIEMDKKSPKTQRRATEVSEYAYTIKDNTFGEFNVKKTANAFWQSSTKVEALIQAYKMDCTHKEACILAGISPRQLKYLIETHPEFCTIIEDCRHVLTFIARQTVIRQMATDGNLAFKYLERKLPEEFGKKSGLVDVSVYTRNRMAEIREKYSK